VPTVLLVFLFDSYFYGYWTLTPWNFFQFNFLSGRSAIFGTMEPYW